MFSFLEIKFQNGAHLKKKGYFDIFFTLSPGKSYINSFSTYLTHIHTRILLTLLTFFALPIWKKNTNLSGMVREVNNRLTGWAFAHPVN